MTTPLSVPTGSSASSPYIPDLSESADIQQALKLLYYGSSATASSTAGIYGMFSYLLNAQTANYFYAGPSSGSAAAPSFRAIVPSDLATGGILGQVPILSSGGFSWTNVITTSSGAATTAIKLKVGSSTVGSAPLYFQSGTNLASATAGAMEYDGTNLYFTPSTTRKTIAFTDSAMTGTVNGITLSSSGTPTITFPTTSSTAMTLANPGILTGTLTLRAGTSSAGTAPLYLQSGTNLTTPATGAIEYDGNVFYATPKVNNSTAGRGLLQSSQIFVNDQQINFASGALSTTTYTGNAFGKSIYLAASTIYQVEASMMIVTTVTTAGTLTLALSTPTGATASINGYSSYSSSSSTVNTASTNFGLTAGTTSTIVSSSFTNGYVARIIFSGIVKTSTTAGNFALIGGFTNGTGSSSIGTLPNSYIKVTPIGPAGADINIGGWA